MRDKKSPDTNEHRTEHHLFIKLLALGGAFLSALFLLNFTCGICEIPDNLPILGNIDEFLASSIFIGYMSILGIDLVPFTEKIKNRKK